MPGSTSPARMREQMKTDVFYWHGYASIYLEGKWVKATPAFNIELCEKFLRLLEFDGRTDSIHLRPRREPAHGIPRLPRRSSPTTHRGHHGDLHQGYRPDEEQQGDFDREVEQETGKGRSTLHASS